MNLFNIKYLIHICFPWHGHVFFPISILVLSYIPPAEVSHDMELAYRSVRAHTPLSVNNWDLNKTSVGRRTSIGLQSEDYNLVVVVFLFSMKCKVMGCNSYSNNVTLVCYRRLSVGDLVQCKLWLLAIGHPNINTLRDVLQQKTSVLCIFSDQFLDSDRGGMKESITQENCCSLSLPWSHWSTCTSKIKNLLVPYNHSQNQIRPSSFVLWCSQMCKACKFPQELLSLFTQAKIGEQLVRRDLKRLLFERPDLLLFKNDNYTKTKYNNNKQNSTNLTPRLFKV